MIEIKNVSKTYNGKKMALDKVSFTVNDGEIFAFIGHNGAGKTTLINEGDILINGKSIKKDPIACKKEIAYIPDNPDLYENMKAIDFINFICDMYGVSKEERSVNIKKYADILELSDNLGDEISSFSHGMKQKVALIAALSHDPKIFYDMKNIMKSMVKENKTIFYSTHILDVAEKICDRVAIIKSGKIVKVGKMKEIKGDESLEQVFLELGDK